MQAVRIKRRRWRHRRSAPLYYQNVSGHMRHEVEQADDGGQWAMSIGGGSGEIWFIYLLPQQSLCEPYSTLWPFRKITDWTACSI